MECLGVPNAEANIRPKPQQTVYRIPRVTACRADEMITNNQLL